MAYDYTESGDGPALLFIPGSYSTQAAWKGVLRALSGSYRTITTSLPGYGGTPERRGGDVGNMDEMTDFVAEVVTRVGEPVHLVGHSYGGLTTYASVMSGKVTALSLVTFEGNPIYAQHPDGPFAWQLGVNDMHDAFGAAVRSGSPEAAGIIIDFWTKPGTFDAMPEAFRTHCAAQAATNFLDWNSAKGFAPQLSDFAKLDMPCTIARGEAANPAIIDLCNAITSHAPRAKLHVEPGAGHFLITTHPAQCAGVIDAHMAAFAQN